MPPTFRNPLVAPDGPDPWMTWHEGFYYLSVTRGDFISLRRAASVLELYDAPEIEVWRDETPSRCTQIWAPEFFQLDGRWYCYYTASDGDIMGHRCYVLESQGDLMGPYRFKAKLQTDENDALYAIDGSIVENARGIRYFLWAGFPDHRLFISRTANPWTLTGKRVMLEADGFGCEEVREGPVCLRRNGFIFLVYSICDTAKPNYKLGMLYADEMADLDDVGAWQQYPSPVFARCDENGVFAPGHNSFFRSPDGTEDWICYHAKPWSRVTYEGRSTRIQRFGWDENGFPDFGVPLSLETDIPLPVGDPHLSSDISP